MKLNYRGFDATGRQVADVIDAAGEADARAKLQQQGVYITELAPDGPGGKGGKGGRKGKGRGLKPLAMFTRQLYVLVSSGTPLVDALATLERQIENVGWRATIADVRTRVEEGRGLADSMEAHPGYFDAVYRGLVAAGESGGQLPAMLDRLGTLAQKRLKIRNAMLGALIYPALLSVVAVISLSLLMLFVIPRFGELFETLDAPLPGTTKALLSASELLRGYWWIMILFVVGAIAGLRFYLGTKRGHYTIDSLSLKAPQFGRITKSFITARIVRLLGILLEARIPVVEAFKLTQAAAGNIHYARLLAKAKDAVVAGESISSVFATTDLISPSVAEAVRNGEASGKVGHLLLHMADFLDEDNEVVVRSLASIIEPLILVALGVLVALVTLSLFTPLFDVTTMMGGN